MKYKGYTGSVEYDDKAKLFHGEVLGIRTVITFQGTHVDEIEQAFKDSINDYLAWCKERGKESEKPFSGKFQLRLPPELHREASLAAKAEEVSLNEYVVEAIIERVEKLRKKKTHRRKSVSSSCSKPSVPVAASPKRASP